MFKKFRRSVRWRTTEIGEKFIWAVLCTEAEVADLDAVTGGVEDVLGLEVSVNDLAVMLKKSDMETQSFVF